MKKLFYLAAAITIMASCTSGNLVDGPNTAQTGESGAIVFGSTFQGMTRADHYGADAALRLNNKFIVGGFKGAKGTSTVYDTDGKITTPGVPATGMVFDNYQVNWVTNTAGTTQSNSADWEYVGFPFLKPSTLVNTEGVNQSIKYWDYTADQYDFIAYSTGNATAIAEGEPTTNQVLVKAIDAGNAGKTAGAYTLRGAAADLEKCYIADMVTAYKTGGSMTPKQPKFQDEIQFKFRALASKVRVALYETIPGYSVKDVKFYTNANANLGTATATNATLFTMGGEGDENVKNYFYTKGTYTVWFPTIGEDNITKSDYNKAHVAFTAEEKGRTKEFFTLNYTTKEFREKTGTKFLGRSSSEASFAGSVANNYYQIAMPNEDGTVLELRIDYTLESVDGSGEEIKVYGATAFVPAIYAAWKSNYAYTYIFKISDNTNGWTNKVDADHNSTDPAGLYPITFDAVVLETEDYTQSTITNVATPSITTYQKGHVYTDNEYDATKGDIYVQVMKNNNTLATDLDVNGKLYEVVATNSKDKDGKVSEAEIMDALNIVSLDATPVPMNGWELTSVTTTCPTAIPGADGNDVTVPANSAAQFTPSAGKVYAYVYTISTGIPVTVGIANTFTSQPDGWPTGYYTNKACTTEATGTFKAGVYYQKRYKDKKNAYGVKIIRVKA